ncbi:MAG: Asp-tRNA(Asn)/Glu-tRNA(Gln) amidotransferase subunit GatC [Eggerthellaceae bacterium]|nr:Asp-tRNA(Asn)/Glu-tRNA(Gln) amidotransferase subunit GatC [Eggerthellaceae bacterium]
MDIKVLTRLEKLNQLRLTEEQEAEWLAFYDERVAELAELNAIDTENVERMVHVLPLENVLREDIASQPFSREDLQAGAPQADDGYWQVPRTVD